MSGLNLGGGATIRGTYAPVTPASARPSTANPKIADIAYGVSGTGATGDDGAIAGYGSVTVGALALAALVYLWWSLPR